MLKAYQDIAPILTILLFAPPCQASANDTEEEALRQQNILLYKKIQALEETNSEQEKLLRKQKVRITALTERYEKEIRRTRKQKSVIEGLMQTKNQQRKGKS
ncbi:MAG: hypothetical protein ACPGXY_04830 [Alphaproteobacteria bacterium]